MQKDILDQQLQETKIINIELDKILEKKQPSTNS